MGFMEISLQGSDMAANLYHKVQRVEPAEAIKLLRNNLGTDHGSYNTPGYVNVALVLVDGDVELSEALGYKQLVVDAYDALADAIIEMPSEGYEDTVDSLNYILDGLLQLKVTHEC